MQKAFFLTKLNKQTNKHQVKQGGKKKKKKEKPTGVQMNVLNKKDIKL